MANTTLQTNARIEIDPRRFRALSNHGQGWWLDGFDHSLFAAEALPGSLAESGLAGVLSDPISLHRALTTDTGFSTVLGPAAATAVSPDAAYERLLIGEAVAACDRLAPYYHQSGGRQGLVGIMPSPHLAGDGEALERAAMHLATEIDRPNLVLRLPATAPAATAVAHCAERGLSVEAALIASPGRYAELLDAWFGGLERRLAGGGGLTGARLLLGIALRPVDRVADRMLEHCLDTESPAMADPNPAALLGKVALANAHRLYRRLLGVLAAKRWRSLADAGAPEPQLLWSGLHHHNPRYRDLMYVDRLIGPHTGVALDLDTAHAFSDHGFVDDALPGDARESRQVLADLKRLGIDYEEVARRAEALALRELRGAYDDIIKRLHA